MDQYDIKCMQIKQMEIFSVFYDLCKKNNIRVFLAFGTAIGALRHNGFIPWDDDIDLFIFEEDRERLREICLKDLPPNFFYQSVETDPEYRLAIDRIRLSTTTLIEARESNRDINHGVFIDLYPLFKCADDKIGYTRQYISRLLYRCFLMNEPAINQGCLMWFLSSFIIKVTPEFIRCKILRTSNSYVQRLGGNKNFATFYGDEVKLKYPVQWFEKNRTVNFENIEAPVADGVEKCLTMEYGDFMELPPVEKRQVHHEYSFLDFEVGYEAYKYDKYLTTE